MLKSRFFWLFVCGAIWVVVLAGMFVPKAVVDAFEVNQFDRVLHLGALLAMVVTARCVLHRLPSSLFWGGALFWAVALEALQPVLQASREFNWLDVAANLAGVLAAALVLWLFGLARTDS